MEDPGLSLFQGSESIHINAGNKEREEDEEEQEDQKRRNEEINDLLTNAFDDLEEDDDESSINSGHYRDSTRCSEHNDSIITESSLLNTNKESQANPHLQQQYGIYDCVNNSSIYDQNLPQTHKSETDSVIGHLTNARNEFDAHKQISTPYNKGISRANNMNKNSTEVSYELPHPLNCEFAKEPRSQPTDAYTFQDGYPYNYETPANHFTQTNAYPNNGYIDGYNARGKLNKEFDEVTNDSSSDHYNHCFHQSPNGRSNEDLMRYKAAEYNSKEQLEVLYSVRMRENQALREKVQQLENQLESEKNQLTRKLALMQAEVERANLSKNQTQNALVDAKAEIANLQLELTSVKENNAVLEKTNQNMAEELSVARSSIVDLEQKIAVLERVQSLQANDKTHEKFLKQAQEKHETEMKNMQTQIDVLVEKLNAKESAYVTLEYKLEDLRRKHESLIVEKGDKINRLAQALQDSQTQCQNLMDTNSGREVMQLQTQLKIVSQEKDELFKTVQELQHKLEVSRSDAMQYSKELLSFSPEEESDSIRQMKLGDNKSINKSDDIANKLRGELQRCLAGQAVKRKEIIRLENTLAQKQKELDKALTTAEVQRQEAMRYAKRVNQLEIELKSLLSDQAIKANAQIQKLSGHLEEVTKQYETLKEEKKSLESKLEESLSVNQELFSKLQERTIAGQEKETIDEFNKEYLEIHEKAVQRVRQEAQVEIVQLQVQLEQTQKDLDHVKQLYIDVCGRKEQMVNEHKDEIENLKEKYQNFDSLKQELEKCEKELQTQTKLTEKLSKECESYRNNITELEKDLALERRKRDEHAKKICVEIEKAKEEALRELRNAHPNQKISVHLPDYCSEHMDKITQLEEDCRRLEDKLSVAMEEQRKTLDLRMELDDARLKLAQMEISQESWKQKYENVIGEYSELHKKILTLEKDLENSNENSSESLIANRQSGSPEKEYRTLKAKYEELLTEKNACRERIAKLEADLNEAKSATSAFENNSRSQTGQKVSHSENEFLLDRIKQLERDMQAKDAKLQEFEKIKEERDDLVTKLKNQAKQFKQYVKNQKQVSAELSSAACVPEDSLDVQKMKEATIREVREEMEQKVAEKLKAIEDKYRAVLSELQKECGEKTKEVEMIKENMQAEKIQLHTSFKKQEQRVVQVIQTRIDIFQQELRARKLKIDDLQERLRQRENDIEEDRNAIAQVMSEWTTEIRSIQKREENLNGEVKKLKATEENLIMEVKSLKEKEDEMRNSLEILKKKYHFVKKMALNYKEHAEKKDKRFLNECKRIEEGYKKAMTQVQQRIEAIINTQDEMITKKLKDIETGYIEQLKKLRTKYKSKC